MPRCLNAPDRATREDIEAFRGFVLSAEFLVPAPNATMVFDRNDQGQIIMDCPVYFWSSMREGSIYPKTIASNTVDQYASSVHASRISVGVTTLQHK